MDWFPRFINWPAATIAAAIAIPALLVLYFLKLRRREMPVSSTILWRKAIQDLQVNAPFQKLRRNLLLLLQLFILLALLLALAKPVVNLPRSTAGQTTVILVDRSASMSAKMPDGKIRLDEAKRRAKELVNSMPREATAMVIAFDDTPEMMQAWTSDANALRQAIDRIGPTDRKTKLSLTYQLAEAKLFFIPDQLRSNITPPDVRVFSDGRVLDAAELSIKSPVTLERVGDDKTGNIAVVALSAKRNYESPTQVQVFARLANYGPEPASSSVNLTVDGQPVQTGSSNQVFLLPDRWTDQQRLDYTRKEGNRRPTESIEFQIDITQSAVVRVEHMSKDGDALLADDAAQVVVPPPKRMTVLMVSEQRNFLEQALRSLKQLEKVDLISPAEFEELKPTDYDVFVFDGYKPKALPPAGDFLYFGTVADGLKLKVVRDSNGAPVMLDAMGVLDWRRDHPILRGPSFSKLEVAQAIKLDVPLDSEVLIDGMKGPLVVLHRERNAIHVVVAFDVLQSLWPIPPLSTSFVHFMYNLMEFLAVGSNMDVRESLEPGATPRIPRTSLVKGGATLKHVTLIDPAGGTTTHDIPAEGDFALPALNHVGVYKTDPPIPQFEQFAVNLLDANESNLIPADSAPGGRAEDVEQGTGKVRRDLWRYFVMAGIAFLFIEWWVYTRRVHL